MPAIGHQRKQHDTLEHSARKGNNRKGRQKELKRAYKSVDVRGHLIAEAVAVIVDLLGVAQARNVLEGVDREQHRSNIGLEHRNINNRDSRKRSSVSAFD